MRAPVPTPIYIKEGYPGGWMKRLALLSFAFLSVTSCARHARVAVEPDAQEPLEVSILPPSMRELGRRLEANGTVMFTPSIGAVTVA